MREEFFAYSTAAGNVNFSFDARDEGAGVLGTVSTAAQPVAHAYDLESIELQARAYLGREPGAVLYIADAQNRVFRTLINEKHHKIVNRQEAVIARIVSLLVFCVTSLLTIGSAGGGLLGIAAFVLVFVLYLLVVKSGLFNEIEAAVMCEILLMLLLILAIAVHKRPPAQTGLRDALGVVQRAAQ